MNPSKKYPNQFQFRPISQSDLDASDFVCAQVFITLLELTLVYFAIGLAVQSRCDITRPQALDNDFH